MKSENLIFSITYLSIQSNFFLQKNCKKIDHLQDFHVFLRGFPKENPIFIEALDSVCDSNIRPIALTIKRFDM